MSRLVPTVPGGALLLAVALAASGCTTAPPPADPAGAVAASEPPRPPTTRERLVTLAVGAYATPEEIEAGRCFADELIGSVGEAELVQAGVLEPGNVQGLLPQLPKDLVDPWVKAQFDCLDYVKLATRAQTFATGDQVDVLAYAACYGRKVEEEDSRAAARAALLRKPRGEAWRKVSAAADFCLAEASDEELAEDED